LLFKRSENRAKVQLYKTSMFDVTREIVAEFSPPGKRFEAKHVKNRTRRLADFVKTRWPLWT